MDNPIRAYAWGSRTSIALLQDRPAPSAGPEAELWMGGHPGSPSTVRRDGVDCRVGDAVAADPIGMLGAAALDRFGPRLPFMLKVLAADSPLSLQAHPDAATAAERFAAEAATGTADRNYADPYPKPELLVAVEEFDTLCGFREPAVSAAALARLGVPALAPVAARLRTGTVAERLSGATGMLLRWPAGSRGAVVDAVVRAIDAMPEAGGLDFVADLGRRFPGDMGVVVAMLMHRITLQPCEAIWMPAGQLHAYQRGTGIEVLGASDNVLRGGLTGKRVDVDELLRVLHFDVLAEPVMKPAVLAPGVLTWPTPAPEFTLIRVELTAADEPVELVLDGPRIVFCQQGRVHVDDRPDRRGAAAGASLTLEHGQSALGAAGRSVRFSGEGVAYVATTQPYA